MRTLGAVLLLIALLSPPVGAADQIIPLTAELPGGWGPGLPFSPAFRDGTCVTISADNSAIQCAVAVPLGATQIIGLHGWHWVITGSGYVSIKFWHNGGTPHLLWDTFFPGIANGGIQAGGTMVPLFYPGDTGHHAVPGDQVFAQFFCFGGAARCGGAATFNFRVPTP